ncbi:MAG: ABC transporter ATP-binding protein [Gammaproteobacteria bacterium]
MLRLKDVRAEGFGPVSLALEAGECLGLRGVSGSGKTRLLRLIADLDEHQGEITLMGRNQSEHSAMQWRRQVGYIPSESQWWGDRVRDSFQSAPDSARLALPEGILDQPLTQLSSGERQRLAVLRQLDCDPSVLLLDEPSANLDEFTTGLLETLLMDWLLEGDRAMIWISHDNDQLGRISHRVLTMEQGRLAGDRQ